MIYISTDYVFNGNGEEPWNINDKIQPINIYGLSKYHGELAVKRNLEEYYIVRISWVFGSNGNNFVKSMINLGKTRAKLSVVCDQIGTPTYTIDLSVLLVDMIETNKYGVYHVTNEGGYISWYDFASEIMKQASLINSIYRKVSIEPINSCSYPSKAKRPKNSRLNKHTITLNGFKSLPKWKDALSRYIKENEGLINGEIKSD